MHTIFTAAILTLTLGSFSFLYAFLRPSGFVVAMHYTSILLFNKFDLKDFCVAV